MISIKYLILPVALTAAVLTGVSAMAPSSTSAESSASANMRAFERTGFVAGWHVDAKGQVGLLIESKEGEDGDIDRRWFKSPPSTTERTQLEHMLIVIGLHSRTSRAAVTVRGEREGASDGRTPERGFELISIESRNPTRDG